MSGILAALAATAIPAGGGALGTLLDELLADSPFLLLTLGEASGTNANNETGGTDATASGGFSFANAALYSGGPTSLAMTANTGRVVYASSAMPSTLTAMTHVVILKPADVSGVHHLITRDSDSFGRTWQWRLDAGNLDFYKLVGGIQGPVRATHGCSAGTPVMLVQRVNASGTVDLFKNGSALSTTGGPVSAADYGGTTAADLVVGNRSNHNEAVNGDGYSMAASFATAVSDARILAWAQAGGFA